MSKEAMKLALEALEAYKGFIDDAHILEGQWHWLDGLDNVQTALREALAEQPAQQEPVKHELQCICGCSWEIDADGNEELVSSPPAQQEPVALKWQQSPIRTAWGDDMVVASVAIDNDHTLSLYCERDQTPKVDAMFAQRTWVGLTDEEIKELYGDDDNFRMTKKYVVAFTRAIEAAHGIKENT